MGRDREDLLGPRDLGWGDETRHALVQVDSLATAGSEVQVWLRGAPANTRSPR